MKTFKREHGSSAQCKMVPLFRNSMTRDSDHRRLIVRQHDCGHDHVTAVVQDTDIADLPGRRFLSSQWFPDRATSAQTNSRAPSVVLNQIDDLWSPSTFHLARDRRSSCRILACHPVTHAKLRLSCGAHPR